MVGDADKVVGTCVCVYECAVDGDWLAVCGGEKNEENGGSSLWGL